MNRIILFVCLSAALCATAAHAQLPSPPPHPMAGQCTAPSFVPGSSTAAVNPGYLATGDFNKDGRLDLAVAEGAPFFPGNSPDVRILLGDGRGGFSPSATFFALFPEFVLAEDLNRDGILDLAVANPGPDRISVLLGDREGSFGPPNTLTAGLGAGAIVTGDFDRDGRLDLAVANKSSDFVSLLLGDGNGGFGPATNFTVGPVAGGAVSIVAVDFNRDGKLDLVTTTGDVGNVVVLLGTGAGGFSSTTSYFATFPEYVATADFNHDGKLDLVVANPGPDRVSLLLGDGEGSFSDPLSFVAGLQPRSIAVADFNKDGRADLAVANASSDTISILQGTGTGSFSAPFDFPAVSGPLSVVAGDFNRDGRIDVAVAAVNTSTVFILVNTCGMP